MKKGKTFLILLVSLLLLGCSNNNDNISDSTNTKNSTDESSSIQEEDDYIMHNKTNYHTHTYRCNHASGTDKEYVEAAINKGYDLLGFTDHVMLPWTTISNSVRGTYDQIEEYISSLRNLREEYKDDIDILIGFECEWDEAFREYYQYLLDSGKCDYLIFGNHYIDYDTASGTFNEYFAKNDKMMTRELLIRYFENASDALQSGLFKVFAHPDYFMYAWDTWDERTIAYVRDMCMVAKENNVALEINQGDFTNNNTREYPNSGERIRYPYSPFWQIAKEVGNTIVTSVDAHSPSAISSGIGREKALKLVDDLGLELTEDLKIKVSDKESTAPKTSKINVINGTGSTTLSKYDTVTISATIPEGSYFKCWKVNGKEKDNLAKTFVYSELSNKEKETTYEAVIIDKLSSYECTFNKQFAVGNNEFGLLNWNSNMAGTGAVEYGTSSARGANFLVADNGGTLTLSVDIPFEISKIQVASSIGSGNDTTLSIYINDTLIAENVVLTNNNVYYSYNVNKLKGTLKFVYKSTITGKKTYIKSVSIS